jgi:hypothetical protein
MDRFEQDQSDEATEAAPISALEVTDEVLLRTAENAVGGPMTTMTFSNHGRC